MNNKRLGKLPFKTVKNLLKQELGGKQVSTESVEYIQSLLENQLKQLCKEVINLQEEENRLRVFHGLPPKWRFDLTLFIKVSEGGLYSPSGMLKGEGEVRQPNRDIISSCRKELTQ